MITVSQIQLVTIGVYGFNESTFFRSLTEAGVDVLCDLRARRGVRGAEYAFANSLRLQRVLHGLGIRYIHLKQLAPTADIRGVQYEADSRAGQRKRDRQELSRDFVVEYHNKILERFDLEEFTGAIGQSATTVALFCVEREPAACHRSLVANHIAKALGLEVIHIKP